MIHKIKSLYDEGNGLAAFGTLALFHPQPVTLTINVLHLDGNQFTGPQSTAVTGGQ